MASKTGFWDRVSEEVRSASERTRRGAERAFQTGLLRIDLLSLRRDRSRALADLGERVLRLWKAEQLSALETDAEALRLRTRIASIDDRIADKESELERLRAEARAGANDRAGAPVAS